MVYILKRAKESRVSRRTRIVLVIGAAILLALALKTVYAFMRFSHVEQQFPSVQIGDSRSSVIAKMGKPNYHSGACGVIHVPDKSCATECVYSHPFAPLVPEYYIVSFSLDDRVIEADPWDSP
jgi:hypothetical protein